jgi:hypothetical protein
VKQRSLNDWVSSLYASSFVCVEKSYDGRGTSLLQETIFILQDFSKPFLLSRQEEAMKIKELERLNTI